MRIAVGEHAVWSCAPSVGHAGRFVERLRRGHDAEEGVDFAKMIELFVVSVFHCFVSWKKKEEIKNEERRGGKKKKRLFISSK